MKSQGNPRRLLIGRGLVAVGVLVAAAGLFSQACAEEAPEAVMRVVFLRGEDPTQVGLRASDAPLGEVAAAIERELACQMEVPGRLQSLRLTANLSPRAPERLFPALARRLSCRHQVVFRIGKPPAGAPYEQNEGNFAETPAPSPLPRTLEAAGVLALLRRAGVLVETDPATPPQGTVRLPQAKLPLRVTLDSLSRATGLAWWPIVRLAPRKSTSGAAAEEERRQAYYDDLVALTPEERREELLADLEEQDRQPLETEDAALARIVKDVSGLVTTLEQTPVEKRVTVRARLRLIGADYSEVLASLPADRKAQLQPLLEAVRALRERLREPR